MITATVAIAYFRSAIAFIVRHWRVAIVVGLILAIAVHAVLASRKVSRLEADVVRYKAVIEDYKAKQKAQAEAAKTQVKVVEKLVYIEDKRRKEADEQIRIIYRDDPQAADWAATPVPDAVANRLRQF